MFAWPPSYFPTRSKGVSVQTNEAGLIEVGTGVAAGEYEGNGHALLAAPVEHELLARREDVGCNAPQAAHGAVLVRVHTRVVQAEVEGRRTGRKLS